MAGSLNDAFCITALALKKGRACYAYTPTPRIGSDFNVEEVSSDERVHQLGMHYTCISLFCFVRYFDCSMEHIYHWVPMWLIAVLLPFI
jgi:hypothetical protein